MKLFQKVHRMGVAALVGSFLLLVPWPAFGAAVIINHTNADISLIPQSAIEQAKTALHIAYGHTSHGSQLVTGMTGLVGFMNGLGYPADLYAHNNGGTGGALDLRDTPFSGASDLGNPDRTAWAAATRTYLNAHPDINVIIWSWCGQVSSATETNINTYLDLMNGLEQDYPAVTFVYMTGHLDGSGATGNLNLRNQQIRDYCNANDKILYDFADIESYDPDGQINYMELLANDACSYDSDGNGSRDSNWAADWQNTHTVNVDWYSCSSAHSEALNANRKAYAAWWLWATLAGWNSTGTNRAPILAPIGDRSVAVGNSLSFTVSATDFDTGDALTLDAAPLPTGATFDAATGQFDWTPAASDIGPHQVIFHVEDNGVPPQGDEETVTLTVTNSSTPGTAASSGDSGDGGGGGCWIRTLFGGVGVGD